LISSIDTPILSSSGLTCGYWKMTPIEPVIELSPAMIRVAGRCDHVAGRSCKRADVGDDRLLGGNRPDRLEDPFAAIGRAAGRGNRHDKRLDRFVVLDLGETIEKFGVIGDQARDRHMGNMRAPVGRIAEQIKVGRECQADEQHHGGHAPEAKLATQSAAICDHGAVHLFLRSASLTQLFLRRVQ
jgi:hypothetical protein